MLTEKYKVEKKFINAAKAHLLDVQKILFPVVVSPEAAGTFQFTSFKCYRFTWELNTFQGN